MSKKKKIIIISLIVAIISIIAIVMTTNNKEIIKYNVEFETDGGSLVETQLINEGEKAKKPKDPTKEGHIFIEWTYQNQIYDFTLEVTKDLKLIAKWFEIEEENTFVVRFETDGGTTIANQIITEGNKVIRPEAPTKEGYKFIGWYLNDEIYDFESFIIENIELNAKWEKTKETTTSKPSSNKTNNKNDNGITNNDKTEEIKLEAPTLSSGHGSGGIQVYAGLTIGIEGHYAQEGALNEISGWELYEKIGDKYNFVGTKEKYSIDVTVDIGENKTYVARTYALDKKGKKVYSAYSNEYKIDNSKVATPTLSSGHGSGGIQVYAGLTIGIEGHYAQEGALNGISGWELYEKIGDKYNLVETKEKYSIDVTVDIGENKTYVARTYALNKEGKKVYSAYSNEYKIDNSKVATPTLRVGHGSGDIEMYLGFTIATEGYYSKEGALNGISGWELYEKVGNKYNLVGTNEKYSIGVTIDAGESKTFIARAFALNKQGQKIYSAYSNEIAIDN